MAEVVFLLIFFDKIVVKNKIISADLILLSFQKSNQLSLFQILLLVSFCLQIWKQYMQKNYYSYNQLFKFVNFRMFKKQQNQKKESLPQTKDKKQAKEAKRQQKMLEMNQTRTKQEMVIVVDKTPVITESKDIFASHSFDTCPQEYQFVLRKMSLQLCRPYKIPSEVMVDLRPRYATIFIGDKKYPKKLISSLPTYIKNHHNHSAKGFCLVEDKPGLDKDQADFQLGKKKKQEALQNEPEEPQNNQSKDLNPHKTSCHVCKIKISSYLEHIKSLSHKEKIIMSPANKFIQQLAQQYRQVTTKGMEIAKITKLIQQKSEKPDPSVRQPILKSGLFMKKTPIRKQPELQKRAKSEVKKQVKSSKSQEKKLENAREKNISQPKSKK